jgi:hypothetical protein
MVQDQRHKQWKIQLRTLPGSTTEDMTSLWRITKKVTLKLNTHPPLKEPDGIYVGFEVLPEVVMKSIIF